MRRSPHDVVYTPIDVTSSEIAAANGLTPVVTPTVGRHLRVVQSNVSDAQFLKELAAKVRDRGGEGVTGYVFFVEDDELHFHPRTLTEAPATVLEYFTDRKGLLRSFRPSTQSQGAKGAGTQTKDVGVDPRRKAPVEHAADNETAPERPSLGRRTYLVDGNTGEAAYKEQESGRIVASAERSEGFHEEPRQEPAQDLAEGKFAEAELRQVEAVAITMGIPTLRAKGNIEVKGVGGQVLRRLLLPCGAPRHRRGRLLLRAQAAQERAGRRRGRQVGGDPGVAERAGGACGHKGRAASDGADRRRQRPPSLTGGRQPTTRKRHATG